MSTYGVTPTGFVRPTLAELKSALDAKAETIWPGIDISADGKYGQLAGLWLKELSDAWDVAQEVYTSRNVNEASGASLDNTYAEVGVTRIDASPTICYGVQLWGDSGTLISAGTKVQQPRTKINFTLNVDAAISEAVCRTAILEMAVPSGSTTWTVTIDTVAYTYTGTNRDTAGASFETAIEAATDLSVTYSAGVLTIDGTIGNFDSVDFALGALANIAIADDGLAVAGIFTCDVEGPTAVPVDTLTTILNPVTGWGSVTNPLAGASGRYAETDAELRIRASGFYSSGKATEAAIRQAILNNVSGVVACSVTSNRTSSTDVDGRPPHSFETLVEGGAQLDIANVIWDNAPAGIEIHGTISQVIVDSEGRNQTVKFSRPAYAYIWVKVTRTLNGEEPYPVDGDTRIKTAIVEWALATFNSGENVYRRAILTPINTVPGLADVVVTLGNTVDGTTPTAYNASDIAIGATTLAVFDIARITVV